MLQLVSHPVHQRKRKPLLFAVQHFTRNSNPLRQFLQNLLSRSGLKFVLHRQTRDPFNELMIEKGTPDLERCSHAHSIDLGQDIGGEVSLGIEVEQAAKRIAGRGSIVVPRKLTNGMRPSARIGYEVTSIQAAIAVQGWY